MVFKVLDKEIKIIKADGGSEIENKLKSSWMEVGEKGK